MRWINNDVNVVIILMLAAYMKTFLDLIAGYTSNVVVIIWSVIFISA